EFFLRTVSSSIALEHLIVARGATASGRRTEWVGGRGGARDGRLNAYAATMGRRFLSLGRSRCRSGGAKNNCRAKRKFYRGRHFRLLVRWGASCSASGRIDVRASDVAHGMGWRTPSRTGRGTKAPGSIPAGGKQGREYR